MKQTYKIFLFLNLALLLAYSVAMADEAKQYNKDPIIKFFKMGQSEMTTIAPTNALGREINQLYALLTWIGVGIMAIVGILFFVIIFRFREKKHSKATYLGEKRSNILELLWTVIPALILVIIAIPTVKLIFKIEKFPDFADKKAIHYTFGSEADQSYNRYLRVAVIGHQWWWEFEYLGWHILENGEEKFIPINKVAATFFSQVGCFGMFLFTKAKNNHKEKNPHDCHYSYPYPSQQGIKLIDFSPQSIGRRNRSHFRLSHFKEFDNRILIILLSFISHRHRISKQ